MSLIALQGDQNGTGTVSVVAPNTNTNRTITLPDASTTMVGTDTTQTLTNKTINGGALQSDTAKAATGTLVDFTGIPAFTRRITVVFNGVSTNGTGNIRLQLGSGALQSSGYVAANTSGSAGATTITSTTEHILASQVAAAGVFNGHAVFTLIAGNTWIGSSNLGSVGGGANSYQLGSSSVTLAGVLNRLAVVTNGTDTFDAGSINILYE